MTPPLSVDVVTSQAMIPAKKPVIAPQIHPHLFALLQVTPRAMGTTADPRMTPMKVYIRYNSEHFSKIIVKRDYI
jgi:hypothetical protein